MKYICFDLGLSHTGVAISDEGILAEPLTTIHQKDLLKLFSQILKIIQETNPDRVLIGQPRHGQVFELSQNLFNFLQPQTNAQLELISEDHSTRQAEKSFIQKKASLQKRQITQHQAVAAHLLQNYLDEL